MVRPWVITMDSFQSSSCLLVHFLLDQMINGLPHSAQSVHPRAFLITSASGCGLELPSSGRRCFSVVTLPYVASNVWKCPGRRGSGSGNVNPFARISKNFSWGKVGFPQQSGHRWTSPPLGGRYQCLCSVSPPAWLVRFQISIDTGILIPARRRRIFLVFCASKTNFPSIFSHFSENFPKISQFFLGQPKKYSPNLKYFDFFKGFT